MVRAGPMPKPRAVMLEDTDELGNEIGMNIKKAIADHSVTKTWVAVGPSLTTFIDGVLE